MESKPSTRRVYRLTRLTGLDGLKISQEPIPALKLNEVLIEVHAVALNFLEQVVMKGQYNRPIKEDVIPSSDMAGIVVDTGTEVQKWKPGDRVSANVFPDHEYGDGDSSTRYRALGVAYDGVLGDHIILPENFLVQLPSRLSFEEASILPVVGVTAHACFTGPITLQPGDIVLVIGTGGMSIFTLQYAVAAGAKVIVTSSSDEKLAKAIALGAAHGINYRNHPEWDQEVLRLTGGRGVDHTVENGGDATLVQSINSTRVGGIIHAVGFVSEGKGVQNINLMLAQKALTLRGVLIGSRSQFEDLCRKLEHMHIQWHVGHVFSFEDARAGFKLMESGKHFGKVVVRINHS